MAKKKTTQKKHKFKHVAESELTESAAVTTGQSAASIGAKPARAAVLATPGRDFRYVAGDMRRIGIAAVILVAIELVLYYVLTMTPVGAAVYNLVKV